MVCLATATVTMANKLSLSADTQPAHRWYLDADCTANMNLSQPLHWDQCAAKKFNGGDSNCRATLREKDGKWEGECSKPTDLGQSTDCEKMTAYGEAKCNKYTYSKTAGEGACTWAGGACKA